MTSIMIENIDEGLTRRLRVRAAEHGHSMEEEVLDILRTVLNREPVPPRNLGTAIHELFKPLGGVDLEIPPREPMREPPGFD